MATLWVGSRKGLFRYDETASGWQEAGPPAFLAAPVTALLDDPRDGALYVALAHGHFGTKLHRSLDRGASWTELKPPAFARSDDPGAPTVEMLWCIAPAGVDEPGVIYGGTMPGALFRSADRGESWTINQPLWDRPERLRWVGAGFDHDGIHSILVDPRDSRHLVLGVSVGGVWITRDGGQSWDLGGRGFVADYLPPEQSSDLVMQDPHMMVMSPTNPDRVWCQHHCGIYVSDDGGWSFRECRDVKPSSFGFGVAVHPHDPDRAWFAPARKDQYRVPVDGKFVATQTRDGGRSFAIHDKGLPQGKAWDIVYRQALAVDQTGERLAMGSTSGNLWVSGDGGESWQHLSAHLPPIAALAFAP